MVNGLFESDDDEFLQPCHLEEGFEGSSFKGISVADFHALALTDEEKVFSWGAGILGNGTDLFSSRPVLLSLKKIKLISCNENTSLAVGDELYIWGHVGSEKVSTPIEFKSKVNTKDIEFVDVNSEHVVLVTKDKLVLMGTNKPYLQPTYPNNPPILTLPKRNEPVEWPVLFDKHLEGMKKVQLQGNMVFVLFSIPT
jgi:hypothetical protein